MGENTCPKFTGIPEDFAERVCLVYEGVTRNVKKSSGFAAPRYGSEITCLRLPRGDDKKRTIRPFALNTDDVCRIGARSNSQ